MDSKMNPNHNETQSMQLPPPVIEQGSATPNGVQPAEKAPAGAETSQAQPAALPPSGALPLPAVPAAPAPLPANNSQQGMAVPIATPQITDDGDLIEKEWVNKAKQIVERTRDDPYKQSEELTVFKADYMKKRYNKTIKLSK
jgi:hypothetical protein